MKKVLSVFTEKYPRICTRIINTAILDVNGSVLPVKALWDTGATKTCISKEVAATLHLHPLGVMQAHTPSGIGILNTFLVNLVLNNEVVFRNLIVMDSEIGAQGIDVLIGMDIISKGDIAISNYEGKTQFSFRVPSQEHIEFQKDEGTA